jgi:general stress protein YciG
MTEEKKPRGLAAMTPEKRREVQSMGGKSVPADKRAFNDRALARHAGKRGGNRVLKRELPIV